ncbi:MAG TPA: MFS transporter [Actinomycetota bacterium]|jgi:predicted MFS family arabinose efflux permease
MDAPGQASGPPRWREVFGGRLGRLTFGLFLLEVLGAVQILVVTTVMPAVVADLGGINLYGWAFSAASLATVMTIPLAGRATDRLGPVRPLAVMLGVFAVGTLVAGLAPSMPVLIIGRFLQGSGAGAQFAVSIATVAIAYPERLRPRVLALLAAAWVVPGLVGPSIGAALASTVGWRWAFLFLLPVLGLAAALVFPGLSRLPAHRPSGAEAPIRWAIQLGIGAAALLGGVTDARWATLPLVAVGLALVIPALRRLVTGDDAASRRALSWALAAGFLVTFAFFATDGFVPLMLTRVRGLSVFEASLIITLATVAWSAGSWWQSRVAATAAPSRLVGAGGTAIALGTVGVAAGLVHWPLAIPFAAWVVAGVGIGVAYPTVYLVTMDRAGTGTEAGTVALLLVIDTLGTAIGTGLGGSAIAVATARGAGLSAGLAGAFALALLGAVGLVGVAPRLGRAPAAS